MKSASGDNQNETRADWPRVFKIASTDEFQQSLGVAQLAVKLCELKAASSNVSLGEEDRDPQNFLTEAWKLIEAAREHGSRPVGRSHQKAEQWLNEKILVPFKKLCDPKREKGDSETR